MNISEFKKPIDTTNPLYGIAEDIKNNGINDMFVYCLEEALFYVYKEGYWRSLFETQMMLRIETEYPGINKFPIGTKEQVIRQLKILIHKKLDEFNTYDLLNFKSGMFDAKSNNLIAHDPKYLSTLRLPYKYDMLAECPLWIDTLNGIFEGDKNKIDILQEFFGYCLTRDVTREKALLLLGESRSGKSTVLDTLNHLIGEENVSSVTLDCISNPQFTPLLINKLVNIDWDVAVGAENYEANFKVITTGEPIRVNQKYIKAFTFRPYCKMVMAANKFPRITDHSSAFYKRLILLPFNRVFEASEQDIKLKYKLIEELPGIFNWAVKGLDRLEKRGGFEVDKKFMADAMEELREESNPVDVFFREYVEIDVSGGQEITKEDLYNKYREWCVANGNAPMANNKFGSVVYAKYSKFTPKTTMNHTTMKRVWKNLKYVYFKPEALEEQVQWQEKT